MSNVLANLCNLLEFIALAPVSGERGGVPIMGFPWRIPPGFDHALGAKHTYQGSVVFFIDDKLICVPSRWVKHRSMEKTCMFHGEAVKILLDNGDGCVFWVYIDRRISVMNCSNRGDRPIFV